MNLINVQLTEEEYDALLNALRNYKGEDLTIEQLTSLISSLDNPTHEL